MPLVAALEVLRELHGEQLVITSMGPTREWQKWPAEPLVFHYIPSTMGGVVPLALGVALARPEREVIALCGDGSLLMSLGCLVTVAAENAENLTIVLFDNGVYEVTGSQTTAAGAAGVDWPRLVAACGIANLQAIDELEDWREALETMFDRPGPRVVVLRVEPIRNDFSITSPGPMAPRVAELRKTLKR
jgi:thiamine pyrophosphate-dependent acetolactate synthase large subunit-like protein